MLLFLVVKLCSNPSVSLRIGARLRRRREWSKKDFRDEV
jgi:hypothetical protein